MSSLVLEGIGKSYGAVVAVQGASVEIGPGVIHAIVGENGAGKSTLLKIAAGVLSPDAGTVRIFGEALAPHTASEAIRRGVAMVQQHFALIGVFTVLENLVLGAEPATGPFGRLDLPRARVRALEVAGELGVDLPLDARVETLGVGDRQRVEIARALMREARVIILDEPTAVLTPGEATALYATLRRLADGGRCIVVVTHKLDEVTAHAGRVTVMRRGRVVYDGARGEGSAAFDPNALAQAIMGGEPPPPIARQRGAARPHEASPRLALHGVSAGRALRSVSLEVRAGEIVGIAGVEGNGQRELVRVIAGLDEPTEGTMTGGLAAASVVHEDRQAEGLVLDAPVGDNLVLGELGHFSRFGVLDEHAIVAQGTARAERFDVVPRDLGLPARALSGGNQQKIVMARAIARGSAVLVAAHPTRGVDLGAAHAIHTQILEAAGAGAAVLIVSAELAELRALSDRILVMARGAIVADLPPDSSDAEIGARMIGVTP